jgi:rod shape-determining protein MreD
MIYYLTLPVLSILLIALQSIITDIIFSNRFVFEISLMAVIYAGFRLDLIRGVVLAFIIGLMFDYIGGVLPGLSAFLYMIVFLCSFFVSEWMDTEKIHVIVLFAFLCAFVKELALMMLYYLIFDIDPVNGAFLMFFAQALVIGLCAPLFFYMMDRTGIFLYEQRV